MFNALTDLQIRQLFEWVIVREASKPDGEADEFLMSFGNAVRLAGDKEFQLIRELAVTVIAKYQLEFPEMGMGA